MAGVPAAFDSLIDRAEFRTIPHRPGLELYRAHIVKHAFEPHAHEGYGIGAIESGVERFRYAGTEHLAPPRSLVLMNADTLHTGQAETADGWRYRMAYLSPGLLADLSGHADWWFDTPVVARTHRQHQRACALLGQLWTTADPLTCDGLLLVLVRELAPLRSNTREPDERARHRFAPVLAYMQDCLANKLTLDDLARVAGLSPFHFLRAFQREHQVSPHQMLMAMRLHQAKQLLANGQAAADVAASVGLSDQAHLTRAFVKRYGVTPARYQEQVRRH